MNNNDYQERINVPMNLYIQRGVFGTAKRFASKIMQLLKELT